MEIGIILPQGWQGEYDGWSPASAWERTLWLANQAEVLGFESVWFVDHLHTAPVVNDEITFESFTSLSAIAAKTKRVGVGHVVLCAAWRNPGLTAKMISTVDVISGGRATLGIGAGWKKDEWEAYGYGFPSAGERLRILGDYLEVIEAMLQSGHATVVNSSASVLGAVNEPRGIQQPSIPVMVGGNGPEVTWRLASRFADELNLSGKSPEEVAEALPIIASRCEEVDRDPESLRISTHIFGAHSAEAGEPRVDLLGRYADVGVHRVMTRLHASADADDALERFAADAASAGLSLNNA